MKYRHVVYEDETATLIVDATHAGNELRFVNDAKTQNKQPNVVLVPVQMGNHKWHILVLSKSNIAKVNHTF